MFRKIKKSSGFVIMIFTVIIYLSPLLTVFGRNFIILNFLVPFVLLGHSIFLIIRFLRRNYNSYLFLLISILPGLHYVNATFSFHPIEQQIKQNVIRVFSFNVMTFSYFKDPHSTVMGDIARWLKYEKADIICMQEFYNHPAKDNFKSLDKFNTLFPYSIYAPIKLTGNKDYTVTSGAAIFTRFPIINSKNTYFNMQNQNLIQYADLLIDKDTVRVFNIHLESLNHHTYQDKPSIVKYLQTFIENFEYKVVQCNELMRQFESTHYRIIVCGDFNDTPYQYSYNLLKSRFKNAFEKKGNGLGITYSTQLSLARIDNIFVDHSIRISKFTTFDNIIFSDHFPIGAVLDINK